MSKRQELSALRAMQHAKAGGDTQGYLSRRQELDRLRGRSAYSTDARDADDFSQVVPVAYGGGGGRLSDRIGAAFKFGDEAKLNYLEQRGYKNPASLEGDLYYQEGAYMVPFDEAGKPTMADFADLAPDILAAAFTLPFGGPVTSTLSKAALTGAAKQGTASGAASLGNQGIGALLPGEEAATVGQRGLGALFNTAAGGLGSLFGNTGASATERLALNSKTKQALAPFYANAGKNDFAKEGERIAADTGVELSPGAITGSKLLTSLENNARQSLFSKDAAFDADEKVARQLVANIQRQINALSNGAPVDPATLGERIRTSIKTVSGKLVEKRRVQGAEDYSAFERLAGGNVTLPMKNTLAELDNILAEYSTIGTPETRIITKEVETLRKQYSSGAPLKSAQSARSYYGKKAAGEGNMFTTGDKSASTRIAPRILSALSKDFEEAPTGSMSVAAAAAFKMANARYLKNSKDIEYVKNSPLRAIFGEEFFSAEAGGVLMNSVPPEKVAEKLLTLKPTQIAITREILEREGPEVWGQVKAYVLDNALSKGAKAPVSSGGRALSLNAPAFVRALPNDFKNDSTLRAIFSPAEMKAVDDTLNAMRRWSDKAGFNFSGTAQSLELKEILGAMFSGVKGVGAAAVAGGVGLGAVGAVGGAGAQIAGAALTNKKVAELMLNPRARAVMLQITRLPPGSRQAAQAAGVLLGLANSPEPGNPEIDQTKAIADAKGQ